MRLLTVRIQAVGPSLAVVVVPELIDGQDIIACSSRSYSQQRRSAQERGGNKGVDGDKVLFGDKEI